MDDITTDNRIHTADWRARVEEKLDTLIACDRAAQEGQKNHSRRLDALELGFARLEFGERERQRIEAKVNRQDDRITALAREQRWWTSAATVLGVLGNLFGFRGGP